MTAKKNGFADEQEAVTVVSDSSPILHFQLKLATVSQTANVSAEAQEQQVNIDSVTPITLVDRKDIALTPGADRSNSLQMITDYVPGSYFTHDQLHIRGGHQVSWLIDGVPIPNTNIASQPGAPDRPEGHRLSRNPAGRLFRRLRRSNLWCFQRGSTFRF